MLVEIPECKRCCCCLPLRYGLIAWGYIKLFLAGSALVIIIISILLESRSYRSQTPIIIFSFLTIVFIIEIISAILFIYGCRLKNVKLMKIFYFYSMFPLALIVLYSLYVWYLIITDLIHEYHLSLYFTLMLFSAGTLMLICIGLQVYILLLVRSEIIKLKNGCQFRFVNNVTEPACTLNIEQQNDLQIYGEDDKEITT